MGKETLDEENHFQVVLKSFIDYKGINQMDE
jgi:hypothetical protein